VTLAVSLAAKRRTDLEALGAQVPALSGGGAR
jgi:hypothetical protein